MFAGDALFGGAIFTSVADLRKATLGRDAEFGEAAELEQVSLTSVRMAPNAGSARREWLAAWRGEEAADGLADAAPVYRPSRAGSSRRKPARSSLILARATITASAFINATS